MLYSLYLHIPFCVHRCSYCDFNTYAGLEDMIPAYVKALQQEIEISARSADGALPVHTIFFGGGTPSLLLPEQVGSILETIRGCFDLYSNAEITLEANPGTLDPGQLEALRTAGVNRLSFGMQSANTVELHLLERQHNLQDVARAVMDARAAGFDNLNLDLMFGIPFQTIEMWQSSLNTALSLRPDHFSLYALTLEHGTPMKKQVDLGQLPDPDSDLAADMYELASEKMEAAGFSQYEISNWARCDETRGLLTCRHNLQYWRNLPYLGFGAGAHGYANGIRTANILSPAAYIQRLEQGGAETFPVTPTTVEKRSITREDELGETMMMGLRLAEEGVPDAVFYERFGLSLREQFGKQIARLEGQGLLEWNNGSLRLTKRGRLLGNRVFVEFI
jgi:oxygen-independent coproporphyrinogen-3 oxidase